MTLRLCLDDTASHLPVRGVARLTFDARGPSVATPDDLVVALRNAARSMTRRQSIRDLDVVLGQIVPAAVDTVPGVDAGGVSLTEHGAVTSRSPTHPAITKLDQRQSELNEGPCITALEDPDSDGVVLAQDLAGEDRERWPHVAPEAVEAGYRAMLSTQLSVEGGARAALNLYAGRSHVYDAGKLTPGQSSLTGPARATRRPSARR
jgi:hypothetical protein